MPTITEDVSDGATIADRASVGCVENVTDSADFATSTGYTIGYNASSSMGVSATAAPTGHTTQLESSSAGFTDAPAMLVNAAASDTAASTASAATGRTASLSSSGASTSSMAASRIFSTSSSGVAVGAAQPGILLEDSSSADSSSSAALATVAALSDSADSSAAETVNSTVTFELASSADAAAASATQLEANQNEASDAVALDAVILVDPNHTAMWSNTETMAAALWKSVPFNSYAQVNGKIIAANEEGLFSFDADTDASANIAALVAGDKAAHGSQQMKHFEAVYVLGTADGPMQISVETAQGSFDYPTHLASSADQVNHRAKPGKGLKGVVARFTLANVNGKAFDVSAVKATVFDIQRRI